MARTTTTDILNTRLTLDGSDYTAGMKSASGELKTFEKKSAVSLRKLGIGLAGVTAGIFAIKKAFDFGREGAKIAQLENAFKRLGGTIQPLRDVVKNTIDDQTLIQMTNMANILGINQKEFEGLARVGKAYADTAGVDVKFAVESIIVGVARQSRMMLDNVGIIVKVEDANKKMADALGTTIEKLTAAEKRQAFMNATLKAGAVIIGKAGQSGSVVDGYDQMSAGFTNFINETKKSTSTLPRELYEFFFDPGAWLRRARAAQGAAVGEDSFMGAVSADKRAAKIIADRAAAAVAAAAPKTVIAAGGEISGLGAFLATQQAETTALLETQQAMLDARQEMVAVSQEENIAALAANYDMEQQMAIAHGEKLMAVKQKEAAHAQMISDLKGKLALQGIKIGLNLFASGKDLAIGNAYIATYQGAAQALRDVPYPYNFVAAAAVVAAGLAQVKQIRSASASGGGGGSTITTPGAAAQPVAAAAQDINLSIIGAGDLVNKEALAEMFFEGMGDLISASGGRTGNITVGFTEN